MKGRHLVLALLVLFAFSATPVLALDDDIENLSDQYPVLKYIGLQFRGANYTYRDLEVKDIDSDINQIGLTLGGTVDQINSNQEISWSSTQYLGEIHLYPFSRERDLSVYIGLGGHRTESDFDAGEVEHSDLLWDAGAEGTLFWFDETWALNFGGRWYAGVSKDNGLDIVGGATEEIDYDFSGYELKLDVSYDFDPVNLDADYDYLRPYFGVLYHYVSVNADYTAIDGANRSEFEFDYNNDSGDRVKALFGIRTAGFWSGSDFSIDGALGRDTFAVSVSVGLNF